MFIETRKQLCEVKRVQDKETITSYKGQSKASNYCPQNAPYNHRWGFIVSYINTDAQSFECHESLADYFFFISKCRCAEHAGSHLAE